MTWDLKISLHRRHGADKPRDIIIVTRPNGSKETYQDLEAVPADLLPMVQPLIGRLDSAPPAFPKDYAVAALDLAEEAPPSPRRERVRHRTRRKGKTLVIDHIWFEFLVVAGALLLFFMPLYYSRGELLRGQPWTVWTVLKLALAAGGAYLTLAFMINRTTLTVTRQGITIRHGPIPWYGNRTIPAEDLTQLFVQVRRGRYGVNYSLCAETRTGQETLISSGNPVALRQYEQQIEQLLGIEDMPISGEQFR